MRVSVEYAVLWDLDDGPDAIPCGLVVNRGDHVQVRLCGGEGNWGIKERFDEPMEIFQPDATVKTVRPGDPEYFERVLESLFRTFAVTIPVANVEA